MDIRQELRSWDLEFIICYSFKTPEGQVIYTDKNYAHYFVRVIELFGFLLSSCSVLKIALAVINLIKMCKLVSHIYSRSIFLYCFKRWLLVTRREEA